MSRLLRFLIVEDHPFQRTMHRQALLQLGAAEEILCAENGAHAMRVLRDPSIRIDIVISDLMMPDVDGIELITMLHKAAPDIPLVLLSSDETILPVAVTLAKAQGVRVLGSIVKPLTPDKLRPLLHRYLEDGGEGRGVS